MCSSDTKMKVTMHLNSWKAVGKICKKKRQGGKCHYTFVNNVFLNFLHICIYFVLMFLPNIVWDWQCKKIDLEEEKREEEEIKRQSAKRKKRNWSPWPIIVDLRSSRLKPTDYVHYVHHHFSHLLPLVRTYRWWDTGHKISVVCCLSFPIIYFPFWVQNYH